MRTNNIYNLSTKFYKLAQLEDFDEYNKSSVKVNLIYFDISQFQGSISIGLHFTWSLDTVIEGKQISCDGSILSNEIDNENDPQGFLTKNKIIFAGILFKYFYIDGESIFDTIKEKITNCLVEADVNLDYAEDLTREIQDAFEALISEDQFLEFKEVIEEAITIQEIWSNAIQKVQNPSSL